MEVFHSKVFKKLYKKLPQEIQRATDKKLSFYLSQSLLLVFQIFNFSNSLALAREFYYNKLHEAHSFNWRRYRWAYNAFIGSS